MPEIVIPLVIAVVGGVVQHQAASKAADQQEKIADANAARIEAEAAEAARRAALTMSQQRGMMQARAAASGLETEEDETASIMELSMAREQSRQLGWMEAAGASQSSIAKAGGKLAATQTMGQSYANWASIATSAASSDAAMAGYKQL
jgi:hypothetical protein